MKSLLFSLIGGIVGWFAVSLYSGGYDIISLIATLIGVGIGNLIAKRIK
jgi:hypothetical protein